MNQTANRTIIDSIVKVVSQDERVLFAYLYGTVADRGEGNDIDVAVYGAKNQDLHLLSADLKIALHKETGLPPDLFDIRILNGLAEQGDLFGLLYLRDVLSSNRLLLDRDPETRADFLETYGLRYRECEGLIQEVLS